MYYLCVILFVSPYHKLQDKDVNTVHPHPSSVTVLQTEIHSYNRRD